VLKVERLDYSPQRWAAILDQYPHHTLAQRPEWLAFLAETQNGEIVTATINDGASVVGHFVGVMARRFGLRLLGSPFPGWTTSYMGFCLQDCVSHWEAVEALRRFAFSDLGCVHLEFMDRIVATSVARQIGSAFRYYNGYEIDLSHSADELFARMDSACRRCIRKAERSGVQIEEATDDDFATEYYEQLRDVFAKQRLVPTYGIERVRALMRRLHPTGNLLCLRARDPEGRCIATGIFPAANERAYFWGGASWRKYQILRPNELLMWRAWLYWRARGIRFFDMGGAGDYKRKYGGHAISIPWIRMSRYPALDALRATAAHAVRARQRLNALMQPVLSATHTTAPYPRS
jgi:hypothetical protein